MNTKVVSHRPLPKYQWIGPVVRVHWDETFTEDQLYQYIEMVLPEGYSPEEAFQAGLSGELASGFLPENFTREPNE